MGGKLILIFSNVKGELALITLAVDDMKEHLLGGRRGGGRGALAGWGVGVWPGGGGGGWGETPPRVCS